MIQRHYFYNSLRVLLAAATLWTLGCDTQPRCEPGEFRYRGRLPARLFLFEATCQQSCLTSTVDPDCQLECGERAVPDVSGELRGIADEDDLPDQIVDDRLLTLVESTSLQGGRALVWEFGFLDAANGQAPAGWGFMRQGPRTYLTGEWDGSAQFRARVGVALDVNGDGTFSLNPNEGELAAAGSEVLSSAPGRLEIVETSIDEATGIGRIVGRFFLAFESATERPESEVVGCFNLSVGPGASDGGHRRAVYP